MGSHSSVLSLKADCLDRWLNSFDEFKDDFLFQSQLLAKVLGYYPQTDHPSLRVAHENWKARCALWETSYLMAGSDGLSHLKILALLLFQLSSVEWVRELEEFDSSTLRDIQFSGTPEECEATRKDLNGGRGTYLAFQFVIQVINWFEHARVDRQQQFYFRLTTDLEHDVMVYLLSERREEMATYLILSALYARDPM